MFALLDTPPDLQPWVRCIWALNGEAQSQPDPPIAPDGCCEWILHVGHPPLMATSDGWQRQPREFLFGQLKGPLWLHGDEPMDLLAVRFHPHSTASLFRIGGSALAAEPIELGQLHQSLRQLHPAGAFDSLASAYQTMLRSLRRLARDARAFDPLVLQAQLALDREPGRRISRLAKELGVSPRTLERRFLHASGLGPKFYARVQRMQRSLQLLSTPTTNATSVAYAMGYADQAHLTRELATLAGCRPNAVVECE